jgi:hypothetical protein
VGIELRTRHVEFAESEIEGVESAGAGVDSLKAVIKESHVGIGQISGSETANGLNGHIIVGSAIVVIKEIKVALGVGRSQGLGSNTTRVAEVGVTDGIIGEMGQIHKIDLELKTWQRDSSIWRNAAGRRMHASQRVLRNSSGRQW